MPITERIIHLPGLAIPDAVRIARAGAKALHAAQRHDVKLRRPRGGRIRLRFGSWLRLADVHFVSLTPEAGRIRIRVRTLTGNPDYFGRAVEDSAALVARFVRRAAAKG